MRIKKKEIHKHLDDHSLTYILYPIDPTLLIKPLDNFHNKHQHLIDI